MKFQEKSHIWGGKICRTLADYSQISYIDVTKQMLLKKLNLSRNLLPKVFLQLCMSIPLFPLRFPWIPLPEQWPRTLFAQPKTY